MTLCELMKALNKYRATYEIVIVMTHDNCSVYINKSDVELYSYGGTLPPGEVLHKAVEYLDRITGKTKEQ